MQFMCKTWHFRINQLLCVTIYNMRSVSFLNLFDIIR